MIIHGDNDSMVVLDAGKEVAAIIPGTNIKLIHGLGHSLPEPLFDVFVDLITENISKNIIRSSGM